VTAKGKLGTLKLVVSNEILATLEGRQGLGEAEERHQAGAQPFGARRARWSTTWSTASPRASPSTSRSTGVGYRAAVQGKTLNLQLGYSHEVRFPIPDEVKITCEKPTAISLTARRPPARRTDGCGHPRLSQAGAVQGQGHQV